MLGFCVWLLWPAQSFAAALVRFIHAVPGVGKATVEVNAGSGEQVLGSIGFGQVTPYKSIRAGAFQWTLKGGGKTLATGKSTVGNGDYDIAILDNAAGSGVKLGIYRSASATGSTTLLRVIHAAPELGAPMFMLDMHTLANRLPYTSSTRYFAIPAGNYELSAMKPWLMKPGDPRLLDTKGVHFAPGVSYTAIAVGSRGQRVRVVRVVDRGAPLTRPASLVHMTGHSSMGSDAPMGGSVVVRSGDSLWSIAAKLVGPAASNEEISAKLVAVWNMNAKRIPSGDPNVIFPGQRLILPA